LTFVILVQLMKRASHSDAHRLVLVDSDIGSELVINGMAVNENLFTGCFLPSLFFFLFSCTFYFSFLSLRPNVAPLNPAMSLGSTVSYPSRNRGRAYSTNAFFMYLL